MIFLRQPIWYNDKVKVGGKSILNKKWIEHGIKFMSDLFDSKGNVLSELYFTNNCNIQTLFLEYYGLVNSILKYKNNMDFNTPICNMIYPIIPQNVSIFLEDKKVARKYIKIL